MDRRLIDHFVNANLLSRQDMQRAILRASKDKTGVVTQLLDAQLIDEEILAEQIAEFYQHDMLELASFRVDPSALRMITEGIALKAGAMPYAYERGSDRLMLVTYDPERAREVIEMLASATGQAPHISIAPRVWLERMIPYSYQGGSHSSPASGPTPSISSSNGASNSSGFNERPKSGINRRRRRQNQNPMSSSQPGLHSDRVDNALDDFDDFLKDEAPVLSPRSSFAGRPSSHLGIEPVINQANSRRRRQQPRTQNPMDESAFGNLTGGPAFWEDDTNLQQRWGWDESNGGQQQSPPQPPEPQTSGFSLFEQEEEPKTKGQMTLQEIVEMHNRKINSLREESQRQREVIQALADLLVEARVISRRELKKKLAQLRKDG